jgi:hypothetical protein
VVEDGQYSLTILALRIFGDETWAGAWDVVRTVAFSFTYKI